MSKARKAREAAPAVSKVSQSTNLPQAITSDRLPEAEDNDLPVRSKPRDPLDRSIGYEYWTQDFPFGHFRDWRGWEMRFRKWYPEPRILVDFYNSVFARQSERRMAKGYDNAAELRMKVQKIEEFNAQNPNNKVNYLVIDPSDGWGKVDFSKLKDGHIIVPAYLMDFE